MPIIYDEKNKVFNLQTPDTSYVFGIYENKLPIHIHYGKRIEATSAIEEMLDYPVDIFEDFCVRSKDFERPVSMTVLPLELPTYGSGDYRTPVFHAEYADGSTVSRLYYDGHKIYDGKPFLEGLPATYTENDDEAQTLELYLSDSHTGLGVTIFYTAYNDRDVITRSHVIKNNSKDVIKLKNALSGCIELPDMEYDFVKFTGDWARERFVEKNPLSHGKQSVESLRGSSSHHFNPFICLASSGATETSGEVYAMNLVYSGNFESGAYVDSKNRVRLYTGINPFNFAYSATKATALSNIKTASSRFDGGYIIEAAVPWDAINLTYGHGKKFGFEIAINDSSDKGVSRDGVVSWCGDGRSYTDTSKFGTAYIGSK